MKLRKTYKKIRPTKGIKPTIRQQAAADEIMKNRLRHPKDRLTKQQIAQEAGYLTTAPLHSDGVKVALARYGLDEELITTALVEDIKAKPQNRVQELKLGADILNMTKHQQGEGNKTLVVVISGQSATRYGVNNGTPPLTG